MIRRGSYALSKAPSWRRGGATPRLTPLTHRRDTSQRPYSTSPPPASPATPLTDYPTVFSGIQPTGIPHLGNYLGALRQWVDLQTRALTNPNHNPTSLIFSIVDLHALTGTQTPSLLAQHRKESFISLLALGLTPTHSTLFLQSDIPHHTSLHWILSTVASTGYLSRMTQWKSKLSLPTSPNSPTPSPTDLDALRLGLFSYPVLQAADILLYRPSLVPVGEDQAQHIEFARSLARSFNATYCPGGDDSGTSPLFEAPTLQIGEARRIMSLRKPSAKMSKSDPDPRSRILITDSEEEIFGKLKGAVTDSVEGIAYEPVTRPGVANLVDIYRFVRRDARRPEEIVEREFRGCGKAELKTVVARAVVEELRPVRERFQRLMSGEGKGEVMEAYEVGRERARAKAEETMRLVREVVGLREWY